LKSAPGNAEAEEAKMFLQSSHDKMGWICFLVLRSKAMSTYPDNGMIHLSSPYTVPETLARLESILQSRGITEFARIDHSGEAEKVSMKMHPTQLIIFGSPKGGTPVMLATPTAAIDLPLKALVWEDAGGKVWLSYNSAEYLKRRHNIPDELVKNIAVIGPLLEGVVL
jgi:uncharacterized protein (DUF302 family)